MANNLIQNILKICEVLNKHSVQYLIVGGTAVALHGYFRKSINAWGIEADKPDFDFWYNPTYENYFKLLNALTDLGQNVQEFKDEQTPEPRKSFFKFEDTAFTLDFLPALKTPLQFRLSYQNKETANLNDIEVHFIGLNDLLLDKEALARPKDINDIQQLRNKQKSSEP